jgi:ATP-dependent Lon protease
VILPRDNEKDLAEIPDDISKRLEFRLVENMDEVLEIALAGPLKAAVIQGGESRAEPAERTDDGPVTH